MLFVLPSNKSKFVISVTVQADSPQEICCVAKDERNTFYFRRKGIVNGKRKFTLRFPLSPSIMHLKVYNLANGCAMRDEDKSFKVIGFTIAPLKQSDIWMNSDTTSFVKFAKQFCEDASETPTGIWKSDDNKFTIAYLPEIVDRNTGKVLGTPARVAHDSGVIEVSKKHFIHYSVPMRMIILLHEYCHKYMNKIVDRPIDDETSADINALYIYLGLGFPRIEATNAFLSVFSNGNAANKGNNKRYKIIDDFIQKFDQGKFN